MSARLIWTPERDEELVRRYRGGESMIGLGALFGVDAKSIDRRVRELGVHEPRWRQWGAAEDAIVRREWAAGRRCGAIVGILAGETGFSASENAVRQRVVALGLGHRSRADKKTRVHRHLLTPPDGNKVGPLEAMFDAAGVPATAVSFFEAKGHHCRWPFGDTSDLASFRYRGAPVEGCGPYCTGHAQLALERRKDAA